MQEQYNYNILELGDMIVANNPYAVHQNMVALGILNTVDQELTPTLFWDKVFELDVSKTESERILMELLNVQINPSNPYAAELYAVSSDGNLQFALQNGFIQDNSVVQMARDTYERFSSMSPFQILVIILAFLGFLTTLKLTYKVLKNI